MCLQKSNLFTAIFLWRRLACSLLAALHFVSPWHPRCPVLNALYTRPLSIFSYLLFSPAVFIFSFLFVLLDCSADPSFWGALFPRRGRSRASAATDSCGVGVRRILLSAMWGESHSGASLSRFSPLASFSSFLLAFPSHTPFRNPPALPTVILFPLHPFFLLMSSLRATLTSPSHPTPRTVCTCISTACSFPVSASCTRTVSASHSASLYIYRPDLGRFVAQSHPGVPAACPRATRSRYLAFSL